MSRGFMRIPYWRPECSSRKPDQGHIVALRRIGRELTKGQPHPFVLLGEREAARLSQLLDQSCPAEPDTARTIGLGDETVACQIKAQAVTQLDDARHRAG